MRGDLTSSVFHCTEDPYDDTGLWCFYRFLPVFWPECSWPESDRFSYNRRGTCSIRLFDQNVDG